jgi:hypothetical protein
MVFEQQNYNWSHVGNLPSELAEASWCISFLPDEYREKYLQRDHHHFRPNIFKFAECKNALTRFRSS